MAKVTLFDSNSGLYKTMTIIPSNALLAFLASKGYTVVASNPVR